MRRSTRALGVVMKTVPVVVIGAALFASAYGATATKSAKQAESLEKAAASAKEAVQTVVAGLRGLLDGYNAIIDGEAKDVQAAYKKLANDLKGTEKSIAEANKKNAALAKEADKFFKAWEQDNASMSSESMREKSTARMEASKKRYAEMGETLTKAREEFAPVIQNLNDQILLLGRDLSPAAVADMKDEAQALNQQAADATAKVKAMIQSAGQAQAEAEPAPEGAEQD